jgi:hypothetical protein
MFSSPLYWNNTVYFSGNSHSIAAYALKNGVLATPPTAQSIAMAGGHGPGISANGNTSGVLWVIGGKSMSAFDAVSLKQLYSTAQAGTRDTLPAQPHYSTQMVANGKVYVGTQTNLMVYGLLPVLTATAGNNQSAIVGTTLPIPLQVQLLDPYTGQPIPGVTVTFTDGGKGGTFGTPNPVTDSSGSASTTYRFNNVARTITITASNPVVKATMFTETASPGPPKWVVILSGAKQSAQVTTSLPAPIVTKTSDQYSNGIPGTTVTYTDGGAGGSFSPPSVITDSLGRASTVYTTSTKAGALTITATVAGLNPLKISETAAPGPVSAIGVVGGNNQTGPVSSLLPQALVVKVTDKYSNPVPAALVSYSDGGAGGSFSANPVSTDNNGQAGSSYTTPPTSGTVRITASVGSVATQFTETAQ